MNPEKPYPVLVIAAFVCFAIVGTSAPIAEQGAGES
jgi:hypothetical protein